MYISTPLVFVFLTTTLTLPTSNSTGSTLEERSHHGWVGSFTSIDCSGNPIGNRPEFDVNSIKCIKFGPTPYNDHIGVNYGTTQIEQRVALVKAIFYQLVTYAQSSYG